MDASKSWDARAGLPSRRRIPAGRRWMEACARPEGLKLTECRLSDLPSEGGPGAGGWYTAPSEPPVAPVRGLAAPFGAALVVRRVPVSHAALSRRGARRRPAQAA